MDKKKLKEIASIALIAAVMIVFFAAGGLFQWWRCGEMFPNARLACFLGSR